MAKSRQQKNNSSKVKDSGDLAVRPIIWRARESKIKTRPRTLLQAVNYLIKNSKPKGVSRGRGTYKFQGGRYSQRVVIKTRTVRTKGQGYSVLRSHLDYIKRDGVGLDKTEGKVFSERDLNGGEIDKLCQEWGVDRHHFRLIISPEKGAELDLEKFGRDFIKQAEKDLNTSLEWLGVAHYNTDNPHIHLTIRGKDQGGADLVINGDYIARGMRIVAEQIATRELGLKTEHELQLEVIKGIEKLRVTGLDKALEEEARQSEDRTLDLTRQYSCTDEVEGKNLRNKTARLDFLERSGLSRKISANVWILQENFLENLKDLGIQNDIITTMHRERKEINFDQDINFIRPESFGGERIGGKIVYLGQAEELFDRKYMLIEAKDKQIYHVAVPPSPDHENIIKVGNEIEIKGIVDWNGKIHKYLKFTDLARMRTLDAGLSRGLELGFKFGD